MIGIDIVNNLRVKSLIEKYENKFLDKVFTEKEKGYCLKRKDNYICFSGRWAAKEAIIKAFFSLYKETLFMKEIEIISSPFPKAFIKNEKKDILLKKQNLSIYLSISHEKDYSVAIALIK